MTTKSEKSAAARLLGASGASKGGFARAQALTAERRREIAQIAAKAAGAVHRAKAIARRNKESA